MERAFSIWMVGKAENNMIKGSHLLLIVRHKPKMHVSIVRLFRSFVVNTKRLSNFKLGLKTLWTNRRRLHGRKYLVVMFNVLLITVFVLADSSVTNAFGYWVQSDWSGGVGSSTTNQYSSATDVNTANVGHLTLGPQSNWYNPA